MLHECAWLCCSVLMLGQVPHAPPAALSAKEIAAAVRELGDEEFNVREAASRKLLAEGEPVAAALEVAVMSGDAEIGFRAKKILKQFDQGFLPDTSPEMRKTLELFWAESYDEPIDRAFLAEKIGRAATTRSILRMMALERSPDVRAVLARAYLESHALAVRQMVLQGDSQLELMLEVPSASDNRINLGYIEYLRITDKLDDKLAAAMTDQQQNPGHLMLAAKAALMLRAQGDLKRALRIAPANDEHFINSLAIEAGQWNRVRLPAIASKPVTRQVSDDPFAPAGSAKIAANVSRGIIPSGNPASAESLAFQAAIQGLRGDTADRAASLGKLRELAEQQNGLRFSIGCKLILNDEVADGYRLIRQQQNHVALFLLYNLQARRKEALAALDYRLDGEDAVKWLARYPLGPQNDTPNNRLGNAVEVAALLHSAGKQQQAIALLEAIAQKATGDLAPFVASVVRCETNLGLREQAIDHALLIRQRMNEMAMLNALLPPGAMDVAAWWKKSHPGGNDRQMLNDLQAFLQPDARQRLPMEKLQPQIDDIVGSFAGTTASDRSRLQINLAEVLRKHGHLDASLDYTRRGAELNPTPKLMYELAGQLAQRQRYAEASQVYALCWKMDSAQDAYLYLRGDTRFRSGQQLEGRKLVETATLLSLGRPEARMNLAANLDRLGLHSAAAYHYQIVLRCGDLDSTCLAEAASQIAGRSAYSDPARAANLLELSRLQQMTVNGAMDYNRLFSQPHLIHKTRARALLNAGDVDAGIEQLRLALQLLPQEVRIAEEFVPWLEQLDMPGAADGIFDSVYQFHRGVLADFPDYAWHHNALAWLLARTDRRLDEALAEAQRATQLRPDEAGYLDTLAEVHDRRGDHQSAVTTAQKALELAPGNRKLTLRLQRFEAIARGDKAIPTDPDAAPQFSAAAEQRNPDDRWSSGGP